jgi:hypothetical protein
LSENLGVDLSKLPFFTVKFDRPPAAYVYADLLRGDPSIPAEVLQRFAQRRTRQKIVDTVQ